MAATVDELTFDYEDNGQLVRKQVDKAVLSKGAWATVMFKYQELDRRSGQYRDPKIAIVRFKKSNGMYRKQSSFNISSEKQARQIIDTIEQWYGPGVREAGLDDKAPKAAASAPAAESSAPAAESSAPAAAQAPTAPAPDPAPDPTPADSAKTDG